MLEDGVENVDQILSNFNIIVNGHFHEISNSIYHGKEKHLP